MWQCQACGRKFKHEEQSHFCVKITTIDQYIGEQNDEVKPFLQKLRDCIRTAAPEAVEKISWQMPTFWQGENLIHFAAFQNHIGIYPGDLSLIPFKERLSGYRTTKGAVQFPFDKPIDYELVADITRLRVQAVLKKSRK